MLAAEVARFVRLVRLGVERVAALDAVGLDGAGRIRRGAASVALVHLHPAELVVEGAGAIGHACALGLAWVRRLRSRVERVCARPRARARGLGEGGARLVVGDVGLARVGEEGQDGRDALRRSRAARRDGDEESGRRSGTLYNTTMRMGVLHQVVVDCATRRVSHGLLERACGGLRAMRIAVDGSATPSGKQESYLFPHQTG
jgi:hypothetical protein